MMLSYEKKYIFIDTIELVYEYKLIIFCFITYFSDLITYNKKITIWLCREDYDHDVCCVPSGS